MAPPASYLTTLEFLLRQGVDRSLAWSAAIDELKHWDISDLAAIFCQVEREPLDFCPFKQVDELDRRQQLKDRAQDYISHPPRTKIVDTRPISDFFRKTWPSVYEKRDSWLSPPRELVLLSAEPEAGALCVNALGQWSLRRAGYSALSHVWIEGLQRNDEHDGVSKKQIDLIFWTLQSRNVDAEWLWIDVLAVPGGDDDGKKKQVKSADKLLKVSIINNLASIYQNADAILIFDALVWQLKSSDPIALAVVLVCGLWWSRLWTLQEVKLAKKALIISGAAKVVSWSDIQTRLAVAMTFEKDRYHRLWMKFAVSGKNSDDVAITPTDLIRAADQRRTGNDVDYARAFFPVMGLKWRHGMTRDQGMRQIYYSHQHDAVRLLFMYGRPRLPTRPAWAPCELTGLRGVIGRYMQVENRGIRGKLLYASIIQCGDSMRRSGELVVWFTTANGDKFQAALVDSEPAMMLEELRFSAENGSLCLLLPIERDVPEGPNYIRPALLVAKAETEASDGFECSVFCCVRILSPEPVKAEAHNMLIRDSDPKDQDGSGATRYARHKMRSLAFATGVVTGAPLHAATRSGDLRALEKLLDEDDTERDSLGSDGLGALHIAAKMGSVEMVALLIAHGAWVNLPARSIAGGEKPVMLAVQGNHVLVIHQLAKAGADLEALNDKSETALMIAARDYKVNAALELISVGASLNRQQGLYQESPLFIACSNPHPHQDQLAMVRHLLQAGANVNKVHRAKGSTPLHKAVQGADKEVISTLIARGAHLDAREDHTQWTPLKYAVQGERKEVVQLLLENGADCRQSFRGNWTILHFAALCEDAALMQLLLSVAPHLRAPLDAQLDDDGRSALHIAVENDRFETARLLLQAGAEPGIKNHLGQAAPELAQAGSTQKFQLVFAFGHAGSKSSDE